MTSGNNKSKTVKSTVRPRIKNDDVKKQKLKEYAKQLVALLALQQVIMGNLVKEIS